MAVLWLLGAWATRRAAPKGTQFRYSTPLKCVLLAILLVFLFIIFEDRAETTLRIFIGVLFVALLGYGAYIYTARVSLTDTGVEKRSLFGKTTVLYSSISNIREGSRDYVICDHRRPVLKLSRHLDGINNLIRTIKEKSGAKCT